MTSKSRRLTQKTIQAAPTTTNANRLAPMRANANAPQNPEDGSQDNAANESQVTREEMEGSAITIRALKNELQLFRENLSADIKTQIESMRGELRADIAALQKKSQEDVKALRDEFTAQMKTLVENHSESTNTQREMERSLTDVSDRVAVLEKTNENLTREYKKVLEKCVDLENRSRRLNVRILGIGENLENGNPTQFVADLLVQILGRENFDAPLVVDRAHRTLGPRPGPGERPRAFLARLHYYADKEKILRLSRERKQLTYNGARVYIFPDMSPEVSKLRASFKQVKAKLREAGIPYSLYYPAKLNVTVKGSKHVFTDPQKAEEFFAGIAPTNEER